MAITDAMANQFKRDCLDGVHQPGDTYKLALIKPGATGTFDKTYATYVAGMGGDEVPAGGGYSQGGVALSNRSSGISGDTGYVDFDDATWDPASISAIGGVVYNSSRSNKVLGVFNLRDGNGDPATITSTNAEFRVAIPSAGNGLIRVG